MAAPPHKSILESSKNVLISPWKGKLTIQGCVLCDITLWSSYGTVIPAHLPHELHFKYVMRVSSLKERLPEAAFRKQIYLEQKVCCQDLCFNLYEVELSNKQGEEVDKLTEYIKNKQLALIKCLEDRAFFILLSSSALIPEPDTGDEQMSLHVLHLFHSHLATEVKDLKIEDDISWKVAPILPALNCALLEAKKLLPEEGTHPNILVKHNFQELNKVDKNLSLTAAPQDVKKETTFFRKLSGSFDLVPPPEKCSTESLTQLKSYFSDPGGYTLEVSTALGLLAECPPSPYISDGICDAGFSLVMTPDPEFLDSEAEVRKKTQTEKSSEEMFKEKKGAVVPLSAASNLRVQPKRKASMLPIVRSKRVNLCPSFAKRTTPGTDSRSSSPSPLKLVKGQLPQKRKRGAEVVTAQVVQKTKLNRKSQEVPISKDVPVATNTKRARRKEKSPIKTVPRAKPPVKKSPQKRRVNIVKGSQNPRIGKQPQPAKEETALQLQSEISSDGQKDGISMNTAQSQSITVAQKDLPENSIINYDSQALNMLADLALSSAASSTPLCEARNLPCSSELPQNDVLHSKESSLCDTSDHDYHSGVKSQKGILLSKSSCDQKSNSGLDLTASHEEENLVPCSQTPPNAQSALREETEPSGTSQNSLITVEHSYALLLGENSKKHLQQRGLPGPAFAKTGTKGPEAGTPVGKVMPFRHLQNTSPLQKLSEDSLVKHRGRFISSNLKNIFCSHTIISCDGSFKITFKCETEYAFNLDSKYTNNPLEKTVVRALHGPWNTNLPDNMEEVKLLIHMWVALFYRNRNKVIQSSRKVVEHSNPEKYVSINSTLESFELSEIEESSSVERCSIEPLLETKEMSRAHANEVSFHGPKCLLPLIKLPPSRGLELCVENERKEIFARECHLDNSESQNFIHSCNDEVVGGKAKQESANKLEASNLVLSVIGNTQTNGPFSSDEDETFQSVDSKRVVSYNDTGTQATFTRTYDGASSQSEMCEKSVYIPLESRVDILHTTVQTNTNALQDLIQCSSPINNECESSLEKTDDNMEYVMINLEPVTFTLEKDACVPVHTEVNRGEKPLPFSSELINQMLPAADVRHPISALEEAQTQAVRDIPSLAMAGQKSTKYLSASSGKREILDEELLLSQKEMTLPVSSPSSDKALIMEALSLVKCSSYPLPSEEMKHSQDICLQTQNLFSISSEEIIEPSQIEVVSPSVSASLGKRYSNDCVPPKTNIPDDSLELRKNDKSSLNCENVNLESFNAVFAKQTNLLINGQEIGLELQEENSDIDLTLTISPPTSPRGKVPANETKQLQEATGSNLELKDIAEEIIEPKEVTLIEKTEENPASSMSAYSTVSKEPLENERKGDSLQPITLILSKENCTLEIGEEINVTSDFPYGSLIEEVSPSSSPDPLVPIEEARPSQVVSPCSLKLHGTQCEKSNKFSQIESEDIAVTEKENSFVDPSHLVRQENTTQLQQIQLSVKMPLILTNHPGRKGRLMFPGKITEEIVPREHGEGLSFSEKVQCYGTELNKPGLIANYGDNFKPSLEKLVKSGNPLQPISIENRNLGLKHLVLESHEPSFSSRKSIENKSLAEALVSTTSLSGIVNIPLKEQGSPESIKEKLCNSDLKTDGGSYMQVKSVSSVSIDEADVTQAYLHPEIPEFGSASDSATFTQCTRPESIEPGFQTQEISVIRMASLFGNSRTEAELHEEGTDVDAISLQSNSTASTKGEEKTVHTLSDTSVCEMKELLKGEFMPTYACSYQSTIDTSEEPSAFVSESIETLVYGVSKEHIDRKTTSEGHRNEADAKILDRNVDANMNSDKHYEPLSGDSDQDSFNNCRNPRLDMENSGILGSYTSKNEHAAKDGYYSLMCLNNSDNEACDYSNKVPGVKMNIPPRNWATGLKKADECMPHYVQIRDRHGILRTYANFTVTRELKDMTRTLHRVRRHPSFTLNSDLSSWMSTWQVADDLTQNTLDLEYLRFTHKIKQLVKKEGSRQTDSPLEILLRDFPLTEKSEPPVLHPTPRNRSPILVTVMHTDARWQSCHRSGHTPSDLDSSSSFWKERCSHSRNLTNSQRKQTVSFHLNKLKYNSTLKESRNDISLILNEYAEFNKVVMNSNYADFQDKELNMASEEATFQETYPSFSRQSTSYEDIITDLCASLHTKLNSVLKEACKSPFFFYLVETGDKPFFLRTKSILRKGGHTEIEPQHFCHTFHRENDTLVVIIRNEDISSHLHQIPSLLKLKHLPGVIFAGVDNPEDVLNDTHQELFHTGGFVVSDDKILETVTLAQLKEIVKILEKLNGNGRWKWLLHYRENKKLKEDVRMDSVAHKKNLILRSYQSANIIELLPYHQCDSQSQTKAEILKCLINLQIQHVDARFAVFLTDKHISSEVFGNNGILATDVNNFIENIQKIAAPFRSSYW